MIQQCTPAKRVYIVCVTSVPTVCTVEGVYIVCVTSVPTVCTVDHLIVVCVGSLSTSCTDIGVLFVLSI